MSADKNETPTTNATTAPAPVDPQAQQLARDLAEAEKQSQIRLDAVRRRAAAPAQAGVRNRSPDPTEALLRPLVPEAFGPRATKHIFCGDVRKHAQYVSEGKIPLVKDGVHIHDRGDPVYWEPMEIHKARMAETSRLSSAGLEHGTGPRKGAGKLGGPSDDDPETRAATTEQLNVTRKG